MYSLKTVRIFKRAGAVNDLLTTNFMFIATLYYNKKDGDEVPSPGLPHEVGIGDADRQSGSRS
jgi:hypothetical protein